MVILEVEIMADAETTTTKGSPRRSEAETAMDHIRIPTDLKDRAEAVLGELGISPSDAIRVFYKQITLRGELPFDTLIPNEETQEALRATEAGEGLLGPFRDADEMFRELGVELGDP